MEPNQRRSFLPQLLLILLVALEITPPFDWLLKRKLYRLHWKPRNTKFQSELQVGSIIIPKKIMLNILIVIQKS